MFNLLFNLDLIFYLPNPLILLIDNEVFDELSPPWSTNCDGESSVISPFDFSWALSM